MRFCPALQYCLRVRCCLDWRSFVGCLFVCFNVVRSLSMLLHGRVTVFATLFAQPTH